MNAIVDEAGRKSAPDKTIRKIVIVGGGSAGWMTAAALSVATRHEPCRIVLVESEEIGIVGVGESTVPPIKEFNRFLGIDENDFIRNTQSSFKLAIEFVDWKRPGHVYFNPLAGSGFSSHTATSSTVLPPVYEYLLKLAVDGRDPDFDDYSMCSVASRRNRFERPPKNSSEMTYAYAFQFDAVLYAKYLRGYAEKRGVQRMEGKVVDVQLRGENGFIDAVVLQSGERVEGDLFIDCSGFRALLIGQALKVPFEDWTHWLPCDRAFAVPCERAEPLTPYTRATAREAGWQWRIPLQHRVGNGYVFSSNCISEDKAADALLSSLEGRPLAEPRLLKFAAGLRKEAWKKNCVAIGLSSGFVEPLESTSIHLTQTSIMSLIKLFPDRDCGPLVSEDYSRRMRFGFEWIRDFIILHFHATEREDTEFWRYCKHMSIPDTLRVRMEMFQRHGRILINPGEILGPRPWLTVMYNQGLTPESYPPLTNAYGIGEMRAELAKVRAGIKRTVENMPTHEDFIARNCSAAPLAL
ncbi:MAG TPA: tryptophan halogenase family protein [Rhizomicrobium sp.]|jgi:tryptophan halogenase|nr:tryptophan halogenase family protein [Rhizomicrobium sp.]